MNKLIHSVYKITNTSNGKVYIGVSKNLKSRWINHQNAVNYGSKLHEAIRNEGINNFDFFHLADCFTRKDAELFEKDLIKELNTRYPHGYNLTDGGGGTTGRKVSEKLLFTMRNNNPMKRPEIAKKASETLRGRTFPHQAGENNYFYGLTGVNHPGTKYKIIATNIHTQGIVVLSGVKQIEDAGFNYKTVLRRAKSQGKIRVHNNHTFELVSI